MVTPLLTERQVLNRMTDEEIFKMIDLNPYCIGSLDPERLTPAIVDYAMEVNNAVFYHIPSDKITPFCLRLIATHDCLRFRYLPKELVTQEIQTLALEHYPLLLLDCKLIEINEANCNTVFQRHPQLYDTIEILCYRWLCKSERRQRFSQISRILLTKDTRLFKWIQDPTEKEWITALGNHPELLEKAGAKEQTFEMCWVSCKAHLECVKYVKKRDVAGRITSLLLRRDYSLADPMSLVAGFL